jgi:chromate reductase, NAD(P)H dehydrogenase (quinone)
MKIVAICGSTRKSSANLNLILAIQELAAAAFEGGEIEVSILKGLADLPHFNPDLDQERPLEKISAQTHRALTEYRAQLKAADAILICTPEYAAGVPGVLKNAIDWTVSSMEFSRKPTALITASTSGHLAHKSLLGTLLIIEARMTSETSLVVSSVKSKVNDKGQITDGATLENVARVLRGIQEIHEDRVPPSEYLLPPDIRG